MGLIPATATAVAMAAAAARPTLTPPTRGRGGRGRGRGRGGGRGGGNNMSVDHRPRGLIIHGVTKEEKEELRPHFMVRIGERCGETRGRKYGGGWRFVSSILSSAPAPVALT